MYIICLTLFCSYLFKPLSSHNIILQFPEFLDALGIIPNPCETCAALLMRPIEPFQFRLLLAYRLRNPWNEKGEEIDYKITTRKRKSCDAPRSKPVSKKKPKLKKPERTHEKRGAGLARIVYDPKSVEKFGGIVEKCIGARQGLE